MKLALIALLATPASTFVVVSPQAARISPLRGYLDDLSKELYAPVDEPDMEVTYENTVAKTEDVDRFGVGNWNEFVDFDEFDGGDGQMGVAGDGKKGLEKAWKGEAQMAKSKVMSAKNAWGKSTGYAEQLIDQGVEMSRAQQLENWHNQQEVLNQRKTQRFMTDDFDKVSAEEDWRKLASFGIERNQDFDLDQLGAVVPGEKIEAHVELQSRINQPKVYEFKLRNSFMGFSDFRARITPAYPDWTISPAEGSLSGRNDVEFVLKYRPSNPGLTNAYLVIDTEDDKWTWTLTGTASM